MTNIHPDSEKAEFIQSVAFKLFLDQGYEATGVRTICRMAGIEAPSLYYYFGSKKRLFFSIAESLWSEYEIHRDEVNRSMFGLEPDEKLYSLFRSSIRYAEDHMKETRFYFRYCLFPPGDLKEEIVSALGNIRSSREKTIENIMRGCIHKGLVKTDIVKACELYMKFMQNCTFNVIFCGWGPDEKEMRELWAGFLKCRLNAV